ncbi:hypothetical protein [Nocardioides sp. Iso805N]|uniref:hypothetical protein n=1 Tax=Nocardioides sp. Iso805N TaxID=1283287 RepID=UPI00039DF8C5|nr:hypothetical protein [Nocardioides sp. Iso805N]
MTGAPLILKVLAQEFRGVRTVDRPSARHSGHWKPTEAGVMHSGQIGRSQRWQRM